MTHNQTSRAAERPEGQWVTLIRITAAINITQPNKKGNYKTVNRSITKILEILLLQLVSVECS